MAKKSAKSKQKKLEAEVAAIQDSSGPPDRLAEHLEKEKMQPTPKGQQFIEGLAPVRHQAIDDANDVWQGWKAKSREATDKRKEAKVAAFEKMKSHGLTSYTTHDGWILERSEDEKRTARKAKDPGDESGSNEINPSGDNDESVLDALDEESDNDNE